MGATQNKQSLTSESRKIPELRVSTETWTRESHGLYDFEGNEINNANFSLRGSHNIKRADSTIQTVQINQDFEDVVDLNADQVIARCLFKQNSYWIYHKNLIDETSDVVLERKPEEKIWQVVKQTFPPEMDFPCFRLKKRDLIKVGRVRFKIRDIMSSVYLEKNKIEDQCSAKFQQVYPSYDLSSIHDQSEMDDHSRLGGHQVPQDELDDTDSDVEVEIGEHQNQNIQGQLLNLAITSIDLAKILIPIPQKEKQTKDNVEQSQVSKPKDDQAVCRICLTEEEEVNNPLLAPCKCAGSMRFIHHQCLQQWFHQRRVMKVSSIVSTYFWKNLECELCKQSYPYETKSIDGREMLNIIEYDIPENTSNYIVLESISSNTSKVIHVIDMAKTFKLFIGRGHDAHVRVTDISVSRLHAILFKASNGYYYLTDNESKFGTLALVRSPLQLMPKMKTQLQISRTLLNIEVREPQKSLLQACLCMGQEKDKQKDDQSQESLMSLDGIDYFPTEFASKSFIKLMSARKQKQTRVLIYKQKSGGSLKKSDPQHNQITTQQNDSIQEVNEQQQQQYLANNQQDITYQNQHNSHGIIEQDQSSLNHSIVSDLGQEQERVVSSGEEESNDDQDGGAENESEESEQEEAEQDSVRLQQQELEQLEQAIQESLQIQQQLHQSRDLPNKPQLNLSILNLEKMIPEQSSQSIVVKEDEEHKYNPVEVVEQQLDGDIGDSLSTSRISSEQVELKSTMLLQQQISHLMIKDLADEGTQQQDNEQSEQGTILHDMPTQVYQKAKVLSLGEKPQTQRSLHQNDFGVKRNDLKSQRAQVPIQLEIARQIIIEQQDDGVEDQVQSKESLGSQQLGQPDERSHASGSRQEQLITTIDAQIPLSMTEVIPLSMTEVIPLLLV